MIATFFQLAARFGVKLSRLDSLTRKLNKAEKVASKKHGPTRKNQAARAERLHRILAGRP